MLPASGFSSLASLRQLELGRKMMFSPTDVVSAVIIMVSHMQTVFSTDVLTSWSSGILCRQPKLRPLFPLGDSWVDNLLVCGKSNAACGLHFLAIVVKSPGDNRLGTILVRCSCVLGKRINGGGGILKILVVRPVSVSMSKLSCNCGGQSLTCLQLSTFCADITIADLVKTPLKVIGLLGGVVDSWSRRKCYRRPLTQMKTEWDPSESHDYEQLEFISSFTLRTYELPPGFEID